MGINDMRPDHTGVKKMALFDIIEESVESEESNENEESKESEELKESDQI